MEGVTDRAHAEAIRRAHPRVLAKLLAVTGTLADAEDAAQEAACRALSAWPSSGLPDAPEAWLVTVAHNAHRDRRRRDRRTEVVGEGGEVLDALAVGSPFARLVLPDERTGRGFDDELLRLLFACCHPALEDGESAALALATLLGLSTDEIARAFVAAPRAIEQRLARARKRLRERGDVEGTTPERGLARLPAVLRTVHLLFNEGYWSASDEAPIRADLCALSLSLARSLAAAFPREPEPLGLVALLVFHEARRPTRLDGEGRPVALPDQDRTAWDAGALAAGKEILDRALALGRPGPCQIEAAIAATHCAARSADETDWAEIAALYAILEAHRPTPAVRVNRAFALGRAKGAGEGLSLLDRGDIDVGREPYVHVVRGTLLAETGRTDEAVASLRAALGAARNTHERGRILARLQALGDHHESQ